MPAVPVRRLVLVVEDEAGIREILALVLADEGYKVECAGGGREALDYLAHHRPAVMVSDIRRMPPRLRGPASAIDAAAIRQPLNDEVC